MSRSVKVDGVSAQDVAAAVGAVVEERGRRYVRDGAVLFSEWHAGALQLRAVVRGGEGQIYSTIVRFDVGRGGALLLVDGECSCPVGVMCKHVAAAALSAVVVSPAAAEPTWETTLEALLGPTTNLPPPPTSALAVELTPDGAGGLVARLVRRGAKGWVYGGLLWNRLLQPAAAAQHHPEHLALVRELYLLHQAGRADSGFSPYRHFGYGLDEKQIDLAEIASPRLWSLLDAAADVGLDFLPARHRLGPVARGDRLALSLDVTAGPDEGSLGIRPVLRSGEVEATDLRPVAFLGGDLAHGVATVSRAEDLAPASSRLTLSRLDPPVARSVWRAALDDAEVAVPADAVGAFRARFAPRLAELRGVTSSDGSFAPPRIGPPVLVLRAVFSGEHALSLTWEWSYDIDGADTRVGLARRSASGERFRDHGAEDAVLDALDDLPVDWGRFRVHPTAHHGPHRFIGLQTAAFVTEAFPVLDDAEGVRVERSGTLTDYREVGDDVAIEVSTTESDTGNDWFDLGVSVVAEGREVPFTKVFKALATGQTHLLLPDGAFFSLQKPEFVALRTLIDEARAMQDRPANGQLRVSPYQATWWEELAALGVVTHQAEAWRERVDGLLASGAVEPAPVPTSLRADLRPYQQAGFAWLSFLWRHRLGGVLADDMGLGKTLQALALIAHARETEPGGGPVLIVAPTSVVANWTAEAARFTPELRVVALTDTLRRRGQELEDVVEGADVVVTSYTLFRLDAEAHERIGWSAALFDEAQFLKNRRSKAYSCARRLAAPFKLAITGTPMENDLMELWSLLSITAPGLFPNPETFRQDYAKKIEKGDDELLARLRRRIRPLMLRRTKEQVAPELPAKQEQVLPVELTPAHHRIYQRVLQRERQKILQLLGDVDANRISILASITRLRQLSLHPALVGEDGAAGSAKIDLLVEQIEDVAGAGHRALVFSQFTGFLAHVRHALDDAGIAYAYLDGSTKDRAAAIAEFKDGDAPVFLISLKAGGFGLNLTEADYCFLLDPWWNPATEAQAIDRTHRIGQERTVMVYRLIAADTIEEKVRALAQRKAALTAGVMDDGAAFAATLDADDIRDLVS